jgi:hypothetical protein
MVMMDVRVPNVKGTLVTSIVKFLRSQREAAAVFLPDTCQHYLDERALDSSWYPEADFLELIRAASRLFPTTRTQALMAIGRESLNLYVRDKKYAELHQFKQLADMPRRLVALWSAQHDTGRMTMQVTSESQATIRLAGFGHPSTELCTVLTGYFTALLSANGSSEPLVEKVACTLNGAAECIWQLRM